MTNQAITSVSDICVAFESLGRKKYNVGVWIEPRLGVAGQQAAWLYSADELLHFDVLDDLLPSIATDERRPLGVYDGDDLMLWLEEQSVLVPPNRGVICSEIDALLSTFPGPGATNFYGQVSRLVLQKPIVLITKLRDHVVAGQYPDDRIWDIVVQEG